MERKQLGNTHNNLSYITQKTFTIKSEKTSQSEISTNKYMTEKCAPWPYKKESAEKWII